VQTNHVLIDYENVQVKSLALLKGEHFKVHVFLGPKNMKLHRDLVFAMQTFGERGKYVTLAAHANSALAFHIAYYLGVLAPTDSSAFFYVISKDTGFDPLLQHLKARGIACGRSVSIEAMPCFKQAPAETATLPRISNEGNDETPAPALLDNLVTLVVNDLIKRKAARPRTPKTLRSTIHARCGKERSDAVIDAVYDALIQRGYVKADGAKVTYSLPAD